MAIQNQSKMEDFLTLQDIARFYASLPGSVDQVYKSAIHHFPNLIPSYGVFKEVTEKLRENDSKVIETREYLIQRQKESTKERRKIKLEEEEIQRQSRRISKQAIMKMSQREYEEVVLAGLPDYARKIMGLHD